MGGFVYLDDEFSSSWMVSIIREVSAVIVCYRAQLALGEVFRSVNFISFMLFLCPFSANALANEFHLSEILTSL